MRNLFVALLLSVLLAGCVAVTDQGVTWTLKPIIDYRVPSPAVVEALEELEAECIDLNSADVELLQAIVHIGPVRAAAIETMRERIVFESPDDLRLISGISDRRVEQIREQGIICLGD